MFKLLISIDSCVSASHSESDSESYHLPTGDPINRTHWHHILPGSSFHTLLPIANSFNLNVPPSSADAIASTRTLVLQGTILHLQKIQQKVSHFASVENLVSIFQKICEVVSVSDATYNWQVCKIY